jgi:hypothetical protein
MKSELTSDFVKSFAQLPARVKQTARKNYQLWKQNPSHPSLEFKKLLKQPDTIVWFWIASHSEYDKLLKRF